MNLLASRIAVKIKNANPEETHSIEIMQYSLGIIFNTLLIIVSTAIISLTWGHFAESITFLLCFSILRLASGGFHLKTTMACNIVTILLSTLLPFFITFSDSTLWIVNSINLIIVIMYAPNPDKNARIPTFLYSILKLISIVIVSSNFFFQSNVLGLAFLVQALTVIPWTRRRTQ